MQLRDLATQLGATLVLPRGANPGAEAKITGLAPIATAKAGQVTFIAQDEYLTYLPTTQASAVIVRTASEDVRAAQLVHKNPYWAFAKAAQIFYPPKPERPGISALAFVAPTAVVDASATLYPFAYVGERARLGAKVVLYPGAYVGDDAEVGDDSVLRANVVVEHGVRVGKRALIHAGTVIGADGFGFAAGEAGHAKIPQVGGVVIGDDVEIGGLSTVDRGAMDNTRIGNGSKLDSHVHVGHGVQLGEHVLMCAFAGIAGSAKLGNWVTMGGHSAIDNRVTLVDRSTVGAMSAMTKDATDPGVYLGFPAIPASEWRRQVARVRRLGDLEARVKDLEKRLGVKPAGD